MAIVGGLDVHRRQITFDWLDSESGEVRRGRIPGDRLGFRAWLDQLEQRPADFAVEGCTGWRFVVEELERAGMGAHLAEPADTQALRGPKRHAKTDGIDARHLRDLLRAGTLPESWIPPTHIQEMRARVRLYKELIELRTAWVQRIHAVRYHQGLPTLSPSAAPGRRRYLDGEEALSPAGRDWVAAALRLLDHVDGELAQLRALFTRFARQQPGCRALSEEYGVGPVTAVAIWAEIGDCRRFSSSREAVRYSGLDITVYSSDAKRARGHLSRQGSPVLRWALFEAAQCGARPSSTDHAYHAAVKERAGSKQAALSVARKLARRAHHRLRSLGDQAMVPVG